MHSAGTLRHTISVYLSQPDSSLAHVKSQKPKSSTIYNKISYELHNLTYKPGQEQEPQEKYLGVPRGLKWSILTDFEDADFRILFPPRPITEEPSRYPATVVS